MHLSGPKDVEELTESSAHSIGRPQSGRALAAAVGIMLGRPPRKWRVSKDEGDLLNDPPAPVLAGLQRAGDRVLSWRACGASRLLRSRVCRSERPPSPLPADTLPAATPAGHRRSLEGSGSRCAPGADTARRWPYRRGWSSRRRSRRPGRVPRAGPFSLCRRPASHGWHVRILTRRAASSSSAPSNPYRTWVLGWGRGWNWRSAAGQPRIRVWQLSPRGPAAQRERDHLGPADCALGTSSLPVHARPRSPTSSASRPRP
jgi:hypothetical protein